MRAIARFLPAVLVLLLVVPTAPVVAAVSPDQAEADLAQLHGYIKKKSSLNEDFLAYLDAVRQAYNDFEKPEAPPDDAGEDEKKAHAAALKKVEKAQLEYNKDAEKAFFKCLTLKRLDRSGATNERDQVNIRAANIIGDLGAVVDADGRKDLSKKLMKAIESFDKAKYQVNSEHLEAMFGALGKLGNLGSLTWMAENYTHTKNRPEDVVRLVAAQKAMILFKDVPGTQRYEIVKEMTKTYSSTEAQAEQSSTDPAVQSAKAFWDQIRVDAIRCVQYYAGEPTDSEGQAFNTMNDLYYWFKDNKSKKAAAWQDEKIKK